MKPVTRYTNLTNMAYESIREAIITGQIKPGERLGQSALARELEVSERTVREAFARLVAKGLAVHEPYKGVRVADLPLEELMEVYRMRALLEGHALILAASRISQADITQMGELLPLTQAGDTPASVKSAQEANHAFHWIAIHAAGSQALSSILEQLWGMMFAYDLLYQPLDINIRAKDYDQHQRLLSALAGRDGTLAAEVNSEHIDTTIQAILLRLEDQIIASA